MRAQYSMYSTVSTPVKLKMTLTSRIVTRYAASTPATGWTKHGSVRRYGRVAYVHASRSSTSPTCILDRAFRDSHVPNPNSFGSMSQVFGKTSSSLSSANNSQSWQRPGEEPSLDVWVRRWLSREKQQGGLETGELSIPLVFRKP